MASKLSQIKDQIVTSLETLTINTKTPTAIRGKGAQDNAKGAPLFDVGFASDSTFSLTSSGVLYRTVDLGIWISGNVADMNESIDQIATFFLNQNGTPRAALRALNVGFVDMTPTAASEAEMHKGDDSWGLVRFDILIKYAFS